MRSRATALVVKDSMILLMHRFNHGDEYWVLPGGGVEEGESDAEAVTRELREETSITAAAGEKVMDYIDAKGERHAVFCCEYISGEPALMPGSVEAIQDSAEQSYTPTWVWLEDVPGLTVYPREEKEYILSI